MEKIEPRKAKQILAEELLQLAGTCNLLKKLIVGLGTPTTMRSHYGSQSFLRLFIQLNSMYRVTKYYQRQAPELLDVASLSSISRIVMESAQVLSYLTETGIGPDQFNFRMQLMSFHQSSEIRRVWEKLGFPDEDFGTFWHKDEVASGPGRLKENEVFRTLETKVQEAMLTGNKAYYFSLMKARNGPLSKSMHSALYKFFSNSIHSQPWALGNAVGLESDYVLKPLSVAVLSLSAASAYSAFGALKYIALRKTARDLITAEEFAFLQDTASGRRVENWIQSEKLRIRDSNKSWARVTTKFRKE